MVNVFSVSEQHVVGVDGPPAPRAPIRVRARVPYRRAHAACISPHLGIQLGWFLRLRLKIGLAAEFCQPVPTHCRTPLHPLRDNTSVHRSRTVASFLQRPSRSWIRRHYVTGRIVWREAAIRSFRRTLLDDPCGPNQSGIEGDASCAHPADNEPECTEQTIVRPTLSFPLGCQTVLVVSCAYPFCDK